jgi:hypothetical protein
MKLGSSCAGCERPAPRCETRLQERPTHGEKHTLRTGLAKGRAQVRFMEQLHGVFVSERLELLADEAHAHLDLVQACESPDELPERSCMLHGLGAPFGRLPRGLQNVTLTHCVAGLAST